jgi:starvation-inducible DNA-binding protein
MTTQTAKTYRKAPLATPTNLSANAVRDLSGALTTLLADFFALYLKTKNFHWHISGQHFRDYHLMLDEQGDQIFGATDAIAERVRKIGGTILVDRVISWQQRILDNDADSDPARHAAELRQDNFQLTASMRETHGLCDEHATSRLRACWKSER